MRGMYEPVFGQYASDLQHSQKLRLAHMKTKTETVTKRPSGQLDQSKLNAFLNRAIADLAAGYGGVMVSLGRQLGLYEVLAGA